MKKGIFCSLMTIVVLAWFLPALGKYADVPMPKEYIIISDSSGVSDSLKSFLGEHRGRWRFGSHFGEYAILVILNFKNDSEAEILYAHGASRYGPPPEYRIMAANLVEQKKQGTVVTVVEFLENDIKVGKIKYEFWLGKKGLKGRKFFLDRKSIPPRDILMEKVG